MMETLIELVAASFERHGIECPTGDSSAAGQADLPVYALPIELKSQVDRAALPEHSYRKKPEASPAA